MVLLYTPNTRPERVTVPIVSIASTFDGLNPSPDFELLSVTRGTSGTSETATIRRRYGALRQPWQSAERTYYPANLDGWWVRVAASGQTIFVGTITDDGRDIYGDGSGKQAYRAQGPLHLLSKIWIDRSWWETLAGATGEIEWVPDFNITPPSLAQKNRAQVAGDDVFGEGQTWNHRLAIQYLLDRHVTPAFDGLVDWTLGGDVELLENLTDPFSAQQVENAASLFSRLIPRDRAMGWYIAPTAAGFEIRVFSLVPRRIVYAGKKIPENRHTARAETSGSHEYYNVATSRSIENQYSKIRVQGARIVTCTTLFGFYAWRDNEHPAWSLVEGWGATPQDDFLQSPEESYRKPLPAPFDPGLPGSYFDDLRKKEYYADVYRHYVAPDTFDFHNGIALPELDKEGNVLPKPLGAAGLAKVQGTVRRTLDWIPLRVGGSYAADANAWSNPEDAELMRPLAWFGYSSWENKIAYWTSAAEYGCTIEPDAENYGFRAKVQPNHILAKKFWTAPNTWAPSDTRPLFDHRYNLFTFACELDYRLAIEVDLPGPGNRGTLVIDVPDAECWVLAPRTVVDVVPLEDRIAGRTVANPFPNWFGWPNINDIQISSPNEMKTLRNDNEKLHAVMAAAIARYGMPRGRASITAKGLRPWVSLLGANLTHVATGAGNERIDGPITQITWNAEGGETIVKGGYAL